VVAVGACAALAGGSSADDALGVVVVARGGSGAGRHEATIAVDANTRTPKRARTSEG
jgi:hypothetical protein